MKMSNIVHHGISGSIDYKRDKLITQIPESWYVQQQEVEYSVNKQVVYITASSSFCLEARRQVGGSDILKEKSYWFMMVLDLFLSLVHHVTLHLFTQHPFV